MTFAFYFTLTSVNFSFISVFSSMDKVFVNLFSVAILLFLLLLFSMDADDVADAAVAEAALGSLSVCVCVWELFLVLEALPFNFKYWLLFKSIKSKFHFIATIDVDVALPLSYCFCCAKNSAALRRVGSGLMSLYECECKCVCVGGGFVCLPGRWTSGEASTSAAAVTLSSFGRRRRRRQLLFMALLLLLILLHATALNNCYFAFAIAISICYLLFSYFDITWFLLFLSLCFVSLFWHTKHDVFFFLHLTKYEP